MEFVDKTQDWLIDTEELLRTYFGACTQNEYIAWGANALGFLLFVVGLVLIF
jgi:hypothetical protein